MKKEGYPESTILATGKRLRNLERHCDLNDPEAVKTYIANLTCSNGFKESLVEAYDLMIRAYSGKWNKPFYDRYDKLPKIPTEERVNILVSSASKRLSLILAMLRDSGMRPIEITWLKMRDVDLEHGIVNITSAKHCVGRTLRLKSQASMLPKAYILRKNSESTMPFSRFSRASFQKRAEESATGLLRKSAMQA